MAEEMISPDKLERGDKVAVLGTSGGIERFPAAFERGLELLENRFELEPVVYSTAEKSTEYLNEHPAEKAEEIMEAFEDPEIKGVVAVTGGDEQLRVLKHLESERLEKNPTRFYGLSDNTNLHIFLNQLGLESFYGGQFVADLMAEGELAEYTFKNLEKAFFQDSLGKIEASEGFADGFVDIEGEEISDTRERFENPGWEFWNFSGPVSGRLFGGCFEILHWQLASGLLDEEDVPGDVLALETSEEAPSEAEVKRWLMCMGEKGFLQKFKAIMVGRPVRQSLHGEEKTLEEKEEYHRKQKQRIREEVERYCPGTPVVFDVDFGHTDPKIPLQLGGKIVLRPEEKALEFQR
ncbi:MAG: S66 peptidase family protein [Candidatus Nanohalobium sp.]